MRVTLVTEYAGVADDGNRGWADLLVAGLAGLGHDPTVVELEGGARTAALRPGSWLAVSATRPDVVQYVPGSGLTRNALVRLRTLRLLVPRAAASIAVLFGGQTVPTPPRLLRPDLALFTSNRLAVRAPGVARGSVVVPPAVDLDRFGPSTRSPAELRSELGLPRDRPLLLHVGHLRPYRNVEALGALAGKGNWTVLVLGSPRYPSAPGLDQRLRERGAVVVREFVPALERYYQAADVYVFPAEDPRGAVEVPLTVLEAMACGVPVATTPFGGLPEFFPASEGLVYAERGRIEEAVRQALRAPRGATRALVAELPPLRQAEVAVLAYEAALAR